MTWLITDYFAEKRLENRIMNETNKSLKELLADKLGISPKRLDIAPDAQAEIAKRDERIAELGRGQQISNEVVECIIESIVKFKGNLHGPKTSPSASSS